MDPARALRARPRRRPVAQPPNCIAIQLHVRRGPGDDPRPRRYGPRPARQRCLALQPARRGPHTPGGPDSALASTPSAADPARATHPPRSYYGSPIFPAPAPRGHRLGEGTRRGPVDVQPGMMPAALLGATHQRHRGPQVRRHHEEHVTGGPVNTFDDRWRPRHPPQRQGSRTHRVVRNHRAVCSHVAVPPRRQGVCAAERCPRSTRRGRSARGGRRLVAARVTKP